MALLADPGWGPSGDPRWEAIGPMGEGLGLTWGGRWKHQDLPHMQLTGTFPVSPTDAVRAAFAAGGVQQVWKEAGLLF
jgi:hypothetical protein